MITVGDKVFVSCVICGASIDPYRTLCSSACVRELDWRKALACTNSRYQIDPESALAKTIKIMESEP